MQPSNQPSSSCTPLAWICSHTVERRERVCAYHCSSIQTENTHTVHNRGRQSSQEDSGMNKNRKEKQKRVHLLPRPKSVMSQLMFPRLSKAKHPLRSGCDSKCNTLDRFRGLNSLFSFSIRGICAFTGMEKKKWIFETMKQEEERRRNDRRGKVKAAVSFHLGQGGDQGRIRREGKKDLLTNWNSITSLPVSAGPPLSHDRRAERKCVGLRQRHTRPVWRQLSVDGSLSHTAELPSPPSHQISFSSKAVNKQGGRLWPPNWNYRKMTKKH